MDDGLIEFNRFLLFESWFVREKVDDISFVWWKFLLDFRFIKLFIINFFFLEFSMMFLWFLMLGFCFIDCLFMFKFFLLFFFGWGRNWFIIFSKFFFIFIDFFFVVFFSVEVFLILFFILEVILFFFEKDSVEILFWFLRFLFFVVFVFVLVEDIGMYFIFWFDFLLL